jgi:hypothetical protein
MRSNELGADIDRGSNPTRSKVKSDGKRLARRGFRIASPELFSKLQSEAATQAGAEACE